MLTSILLLAGCQSHDTKKSDTNLPNAVHEKTKEIRSLQSFPYPNLLAEDEHTYSLLVIGASDEQAPIEKNQNITKHVKSILSLPTVEMAHQAYPKLEFNTKISYMLFDHSRMVYQSKNLKDLTTYLVKNSSVH